MHYAADKRPWRSRKKEILGETQEDVFMSFVQSLLGRYIAPEIEWCPSIRAAGGAS